MSDRSFNVLFLCTGNIENERAFVTAFKYLKNRISVFISLPIRSLDKMALGAKLRDIGRLDGATS
jgi:arsenate reductase (thioredoxin)